MEKPKPGTKKKEKKMFIGTFEDEATNDSCGFNIFFAHTLAEAKKMAADKGLADFAEVGKMYLKGQDF